MILHLIRLSDTEFNGIHLAVFVLGQPKSILFGVVGNLNLILLNESEYFTEAHFAIL